MATDKSKTQIVRAIYDDTNKCINTELVGEASEWADTDLSLTQILRNCLDTDTNKLRIVSI